MKVRLIRGAPEKLKAWSEEHKGKIFDVILVALHGYDIEMTPVGHPGERGYVSSREVEIVEPSDEEIREGTELDPLDFGEQLFRANIFNPTMTDGLIYGYTRDAKIMYARINDALSGPLKFINARNREGVI